MKNACIVIRDKERGFSGDEFEPVVAALIDGGYAPDPVLLVADDDVHAFAQALTDYKNAVNNLFVVAPGDAAAELRLRVCEILQAAIPQGWVVEKQKKLIACLPGGERGAELVRKEIVPFLDARHAVQHDKVVLRAVGVPADTVRSVLREAEQRVAGRLRVHLTESAGDQRFEVIYDNATPKMLVDDVTRQLIAGLGEHVYAADDTPLNRRVVELLTLRGLKLSIAESFTGGGIAQKIVEVPGASKILFESVVAYDNNSKMKRLGVHEATLRGKGAVSDDTAYEMAAGLIAGGDCDVSLATTGIAGPQLDGTDKPVGLCYLAVGTKETVYVYKYVYTGSRAEITRRAITQALYLLYKQLK